MSIYTFLMEGSAATTLQLGLCDATFLENFLGRLPGATDNSSPVTVELNGVVAIRAPMKRTRILWSSCWMSRVAMETRSVSRLIEPICHVPPSWAFETSNFATPRPAFCRDESRTYVWALLSEHAPFRQTTQCRRSIPVNTCFFTQSAAGHDLQRAHDLWRIFFCTFTHSTSPQTQEFHHGHRP